MSAATTTRYMYEYPRMQTTTMHHDGAGRGVEVCLVGGRWPEAPGPVAVAPGGLAPCAPIRASGDPGFCGGCSAASTSSAVPKHNLNTTRPASNLANTLCFVSCSVSRSSAANSSPGPFLGVLPSYIVARLRCPWSRYNLIASHMPFLDIFPVLVG
ncbi:hypothetical protein BKA80DRAFT_325709 [Phyllosticta citrichinensis]